MLSQIASASVSILVLFIGNFWAGSSNRSCHCVCKSDDPELVELVGAQLDRCGPENLAGVTKECPSCWSFPVVCLLILVLLGTLGCGFLLGRGSVGTQGVTSSPLLPLADEPPRWRPSGGSSARIV